MLASPVAPADFRLARASNGAIVNQAALDNAGLVRHQDCSAYELTSGVWVLPGPSLNAAVIEGTDGLIVWETGENVQHGRRYRELIRNISRKPIKAVIYSHTHYTLGTSALLEGEADVLVIGHRRLNENMRLSSAGSYFPEIEPLQRARAIQHAQMLLPESGPDAKHGFVIEPGDRGFVPVNTPVCDRDTLTIAGVRLEFLARGGSDTDDCITVWLPDQCVALNNILWPWQPNFYTPRGAKFRDPRVWSEALRDLLSLRPQYLINQHGRSIAGSEEIEKTLRNYQDFNSLVLDQTLRGILQGKGPDDLRSFVKLPRHLAEDPWLFEAYGKLDWHAPYIMSHAMGWWDGDAASLVRLTPDERAARLLPLLGGRDGVLATVREAGRRGELAWALELLDFAWRLAPDDPELRQLKAELLRRCAYQSTASIVRGFMLSQALALEGKIRLPRVVPPSPQQVCAEPARFVEYWRVRIDPIRSQDAEAVLRFDFTDGDRLSVALHLRRGVVEYVERPAEHHRPADLVLSLSARAFTALYLGESSLDALLDDGRVRLSGSRDDASTFLSYFDGWHA